MLGLPEKPLLVAAFVLAAATLPAGVARADDASGVLRCERAAGPGRVRCAVEVRAPEGREIVWGDVAITALPDLASALRGRLAEESVASRQKSTMSWDFALVARAAGRGEVRARIRLVTCARGPEGGPDAGAALERCLPESVEVQTVLVVGG